MRILIATPDFPPAPGGIQVLIDQLARHLEAHETVVLTLRQPGDHAFDRNLSYRVVRVPAPGRRPAVLALNGALPFVAARMRAEAVISGHIVCAPGALIARRRLGVPVLQYVYAMELTARGKLAAAVLPRVDRTIAISEYARGLAEARGARPELTRTVKPGVDEPPPVLVGARNQLIVTVARLQDRYKGFDVMLRALPLILARVPEAQWVILGDGPLHPELLATANRAGIGSRVRFLGQTSNRVRDEWLARARVFAMPSRVPPGGAGEGFGIVFLEAGRFGVPAVSGAEGGAAEAVLDGVSGTLVDPRDHLAVADAISDLLTDDELQRRYGAAARSRAAELSWEQMARGVETMLEDAVRP